MSAFRNVLVGVELSQTGELLPATQQAVLTAQWLAEKTGASLTFLSVVPDHQQGMAERILSDLAEEAGRGGVQAHALVTKGNPPGAVLHQVERGGHDLVMVGGPAHTGLSYRLAGTTATRLLHECPCPLWLAVRGGPTKVQKVLIASDLTPASDKALRCGVALAKSLKADASALNVVEYPLDHHWASGDRDKITVHYHLKVQEAAKADLREQLARLGNSGEVEVVAVGRTEVPDVEVLHFVRDHPTDLLVLGMRDRGWLQEKLFSHVAEQILPESPCSVLLVKPDGFHGAASV